MTSTYFSFRKSLSQRKTYAPQAPPRFDSRGPLVAPRSARLLTNSRIYRTEGALSEKRKIRYSSVPLIVVRLKPNLDQLTQSISVSVRLPIGESAKLEPAITALANALDQFKPAKGSDRLSWNQKIKSAETAATYIFSADYTSAEPNRDLYSIADIARQITRDFGLLPS